MESLFHKISKAVNQLYAEDEELKVTQEASVEEIHKALSDYSFEKPQPLPDIFDDVIKLMKQWNVHVPHPGYFGLFNPATTNASILADTIVALFNPQLAVWSHAPVANEIEKYTLNHIREKIGLSEKGFFGCFTTGGSEANLTAMLAALATHFPAYLQNGLSSLEAPPVCYLSENAHDSFVKICKNIGIGTDALRKISTDSTWRIDTEKLKFQIEKDKADGLNPFMVIGTAGTTSAGIIDSLPELKTVCKRHNLWFHVDAAWGGAAVFSNRMKPFLDGIQQADSITIDAHKWFSVPLGAGMFFTNHKQAVGQAFNLEADYMPKKSSGLDDPYVTTIQWSRRFIGLKLFMTIAERGDSGIEEMINKFTDLGDYLRKQLAGQGWNIINDTPLPLICFTHPKIKKNNRIVDKILEQIYDRGNYWISSITTKEGEKVFRACITSFHTKRKHIDGLIDELNELIQSKT